MEHAPPQYGTSMHYPSCRIGACTGCLPEPSTVVVIDHPPAFDPTLFAPSPMRMRISTRPQDWAEPARAILEARGAWRT